MKKSTKRKPLPKGMYEMYIKGRKEPIIVQLQAVPIGYVVHESNIKPLKQSDPDAGQLRFYIRCNKLGVYTSIGADNVHHASNKATKLFGPHWTSLQHENNHNLFSLRTMEFVPVVEFKKLLSTLTI